MPNIEKEVVKKVAENYLKEGEIRLTAISNYMQTMETALDKIRSQREFPNPNQSVNDAVIRENTLEALKNAYTVFKYAEENPSPLVMRLPRHITESISETFFDGNTEEFDAFIEAVDAEVENPELNQAENAPAEKKPVAEEEPEAINFFKNADGSISQSLLQALSQGAPYAANDVVDMTYNGQTMFGAFMAYNHLPESRGFTDKTCGFDVLMRKITNVLNTAKTDPSLSKLADNLRANMLPDLLHVKPEEVDGQLHELDKALLQYQKASDKAFNKQYKKDSEEIVKQNKAQGLETLKKLEKEEADAREAEAESKAMTKEDKNAIAKQFNALEKSKGNASALDVADTFLKGIPSATDDRTAAQDKTAVLLFLKNAHDNRGFFGKLFHPIDAIREYFKINALNKELQEVYGGKDRFDRALQDLTDGIKEVKATEPVTVEEKVSLEKQQDDLIEDLTVATDMERTAEQVERTTVQTTAPTKENTKEI